MRLMEPPALWLEMAFEIIMQQYEREREIVVKTCVQPLAGGSWSEMRTSHLSAAASQASWTRPEEVRLDRPGQARPEEVRVDQARPGQAGPDQTGPGQARGGQTSPGEGQVSGDQWGPPFSSEIRLASKDNAGLL